MTFGYYNTAGFSIIASWLGTKKVVKQDALCERPLYHQLLHLACVPYRGKDDSEVKRQAQRQKNQQSRLERNLLEKHFYREMFLVREYRIKNAKLCFIITFPII
jgi:hypothetical protein